MEPKRWGLERELGSLEPGRRAVHDGLLVTGDLCRLDFDLSLPCKRDDSIRSL